MVSFPDGMPWSIGFVKVKAAIDRLAQIEPIRLAEEITPARQTIMKITTAVRN